MNLAGWTHFLRANGRHGSRSTPGSLEMAMPIRRKWWSMAKRSLWAAIAESLAGGAAGRGGAESPGNLRPGNSPDSGTENLSVSISKLPETPGRDTAEVWLAITETGLFIPRLNAGKNAGEDLHQPRSSEDSQDR